MERALDIQVRIMRELGATVESTVTPDGTGPAYHQMGATRMHADPAAGVVDARLRTHELSNLSLVGSSTFPTGGAMNPTLTIAALALKCASHLRADL